MNISDLQQVLHERADDAATGGGDLDALLGKARARRRSRRLAALASAVVLAGGVVAVPLLVSGGWNSSDAPATLVPTVSVPASATPSASVSPSPIPLVSATPSASNSLAACDAPLSCGASLLTPFPSTPLATATPTIASSAAGCGTPVACQGPAVGISDNGPQMSSTRWQNVNSWNTLANDPPYSNDDPFLAVYAGGATIDHSLQSEATWAAVLVITPRDYYAFEHRQVGFLNVGTIYRPAGDPQGKLKVISVNGELLTLNLVGTSEDYVFDAATDTFR
ncbi:MAG TPA: hypothetical protein VHX15_07355 [Frankiaceae bacterium]|jgi:hypothetical protein|nr:hypothetical protein [Frankiaceae bacterium]